MKELTCCKSCGVGRSDISDKEIQSQRNKYDGIYICKHCEDAVEKLAHGEFGKFTNDGRHVLITKDGVYVDRGVRSKNEKFLGFGGSVFLIIETIKDKYFEKKEVYMTNNLFLIKSLHPVLLNKYKHNINAEIVNVGWDSFDKLKEQLDKIQ